MNRDEVHAFLTAERPLGRLQTPDPHALVERYPYCSVLRVMAVEHAHTTGSPDYDERLRIAAVYTFRREMLYELLLRPALDQTVSEFERAIDRQHDDASEELALASEEEQIADTPASDTSQEAAQTGTGRTSPSEAKEPEKTEEVNDAREPSKPVQVAEWGQLDTETQAKEELPSEEMELPVAEVSVAEPAPIAEEHSNSDAFVADAEEDSETENPPKPTPRASDYDDLQREILLEAINSSIELEVMGEDADEAKEEALDPDPSDEPQQPRSETKPTATAAGGNSPYAKWLMRHRLSQHDGTTGNHEALPAEPKAKQSALIDRFIASDPKITPGKAELFSTENLAKMSLVEDEQFVTETMAMIYARQGHVRKAIRAYTVLSLKYPEKSVYFANQIKRLKQRPK